jgi:DNA-directed RNA polymerase subunit L
MEINIIKDELYGKKNGFIQDDNLGILEFEILNEDVSIVNSLRRTMMTDISSLVFRGFPHESNNIMIEKNNTRFNNEYLKHRISCIPILYNDPSNYKVFKENYYYKLNVKIKGDEKEKKLITTNDFELYRRNPQGNDKLIKKNNYLPKYNGEGVPICYLFPKISETEPEEELNITMNIDIGTQKEDACWNMVSKCLFYNIQDEKEVENRKKEFIGKEQEMRDFEILDAQRYYKKNHFNFIVETIGVYKNKEIVKMACESIINKLTKLNEAFSKNTEEFNSPQTLILNNDKSLFYIFKETMSNNNILYTLRLENEDYTIGKLIEKHLDLSVYKYVSFKKEHPHDTYSFIHFVYKNQENINEIKVIEDLKNALNVIIKKYESIYKEFNS